MRNLPFESIYIPEIKLKNGNNVDNAISEIQSKIDICKRKKMAIVGKQIEKENNPEKNTLRISKGKAL